MGKRSKNILILNPPSPESNVTQNFEGKSVSKLKHTWTAQWITHPTASTLDYGVFLFRRSFDLKEKPKSFIIFVSADNRYRLFVNGHAVCFGPALGDLEHYRYETIEIASFLQNGKNVIAAEVVNFGEYRRAAQQTYQTAFILQCNQLPELNTGAKGWKVIKNEAYRPIPFLSTDLNAYYCAGPGDAVQGDLYPWGWQSINFKDDHWLQPRLATIEFAVGRGFLYGSTWFLVPRQIPLMEEKLQRFSKIARFTGTPISTSFVKGNHPIEIPPKCKVSILFDHGVHTVGFPELLVSLGTESKIKITYAESLFYPNAQTLDYFNKDFDPKGNRNEIKGKKIIGIYDLFMPDGGRRRLFRPLWKRTFRYVQLDIETNTEKLILHDFFNIFMGYPFKEIAKFESDDPELRKIWETAWRTLRNGADEIFQDTPYYEQLQYIGDTRLSALTSIYVSGDDRLMRKAIQQFDDSRITEGLTQSRYPSYIKQIIPPFSLFWIAMIHDYLFYRDDATFVKRYLPGIRNVLDWFTNRIDETGMLTNLEWWNFTDWVKGFSNGIPPGADDGYSANITLQLLYALKNAIEIFEYFGWHQETQKYKSLFSQIKHGVFNLCYDSQKEMFAETPQKTLFTQHTNVMAILSDAIEQKAQKPLMQKILNDPELLQTSLYFKFYLFRALQKTGMGDEYLNQLSPWKKMLKNGLTTFAETDNNPRSDCHPWSSTPCFDFLHTVAGIFPTSPGFKQIIIEPNFGYLTQIKATVPTPHGLIKLELKKKSFGELEGTIELPENVTGSFRWKGQKIQLVSGKQNIQIK